MLDAKLVEEGEEFIRRRGHLVTCSRRRQQSAQHADVSDILQPINHVD
jgi:hypothetical protein